MRRAAAVAVSALMLAGCAPSTTGDGGTALSPRPPRVADVDTPQLRALKAEAAIEPCAPGPGTPVEDGLPDLTLPCIGGGAEVNLASLRGPMVINIWANWCPPCKKELPVYAEFDRAHGDRVQVVGIDYSDQFPDKAIRLAQDSGVTYPQLADPAATLIGPLLAPSDGLPIHVFVDDEGRISRVSTEIKSLAQLEDLVEEHLEVQL